MTAPSASRGRLATRGNPSILVLGSYPPPFGGISTHLQSFAPYLRDQGYSVTVVSPGTKADVSEHDGVRVARMTKRREENLASLLPHTLRVGADFLRSRFLSERFLQAESIRVAAAPFAADASLICAYHLIPWGFAGALLAREHDVPLVVVNFGEYYTEPEFFQRHRRQVDFVQKQATKMVAVSRHCGATLSHLGIDRDVELVRLGIDVERFNPGVDASIVRDRFGIRADEPVVLFLGRMIPDMGLPTLLAAIPSYAEHAVTIIGGSRGELTGAAEACAKQFPGRVFVSTDIPYEELPLYYRAASLVVAPSPDNRSCCGLAIKEAMAVGCPIVASSVGGVPEVVVDGETAILVEAENVDGFVTAIMRLVRDPATRAAMGRAGHRRALELFDMRSTHDHLERIFRDSLPA